MLIIVCKTYLWSNWIKAPLFLLITWELIEWGQSSRPYNGSLVKSSYLPYNQPLITICIKGKGVISLQCNGCLFPQWYIVSFVIEVKSSGVIVWLVRHCWLPLSVTKHYKADSFQHLAEGNVSYIMLSMFL